jgi:hypothetical protein
LAAGVSGRAPRARPPITAEPAAARRDEQRAVAGNVNGRYGQLVAVEREEKLERVGVKDLDRVVEQGHGQEARVGRKAHGQHVVGHLQRLDMHDRKAPAQRGAAGVGHQLKLPELDLVVGRARDKAVLLGVHVHGPDGGRVRLHRLEAGAREQVEKLQLAGLRANQHVAVAGRKQHTQAVAGLERAHALARAPVPNLVCVWRGWSAWCRKHPAAVALRRRTLAPGLAVDTRTLPSALSATARTGWRWPARLAAASLTLLTAFLASATVSTCTSLLLKCSTIWDPRVRPRRPGQ